MTDRDSHWMTRALELAERGRGAVEPNPLVGCVIVRGGELVGEGWHQRFGGPHAEIEALRIARERAEGATVYVTLEPCSHHGKTPPCVDALLAARPARVVMAMEDPFLQVAGRGLAALRDAGVEVLVGVHEDAARRLNAPYLTRLCHQRPWVIAKWAMTLDGRLAARGGDSRWISGERSRARVHALRGRMDAILVGVGTVVADDPLLTARPPGLRVPVRVVVDPTLRIPDRARLLATLDEAPLLLAARADADAGRAESLRRLGAEVWTTEAAEPADLIRGLLAELARRGMTNVLAEGGAGLFGSLLDARLVDEAHAFIAPRIVGGADAIPVIGGLGVPRMSDALQLDEVEWECLDGDLYVRGLTRR